MTGLSHEKRPINILCLEDNSLDVDLIGCELEKRNISNVITQVWTREVFEAVLQKGGVDVVLSDSMLPAFDTSNALAFIRQRYPNIPFIFVSGNSSPKLMADALAKGATDYISKSELPKLPKVLEQIGLQNRENKLDTDLPKVGAPVIVQCKDFRCLGYLDKEGKWRYWNDSAELSDVVKWFEADTEEAKGRNRLRSHPDILEQRWSVYANEFNWGACLDVARALTTQNPTRPSGWIHLAYAARRANGGTSRIAYDILFSVIERFPEEPMIFYNLACYACQLDLLAEGRQWLKRAFEINNSIDLRRKALEEPDLKPLRADIPEI